MLFKREALERIAAGDVDLAFRRWRRPTVRAGGTLRTRAGVLAIDSVDPVVEDEISEAEARRAGFADRSALLGSLRGDGQAYRVELRLLGADPRVELRERRIASAAERTDLDGRLARLDRASRHGAWTRRTLTAIAEQPGTRAAELAAGLGRERLPFKRDVRKLKELGLTESLEVGYRLSPRGRSYLDRG